VDEFCYQHAGKAKASNCFDCLRPICVACVKLHGSHDYCPECSAAIGVKQLKRRIVLGAVAASVCLALAVAYALYGNPFRYGAETFAVLDLAAEVKKEPCDRAKVLTLAETYLRVLAPRECLALTDRFFDACGDWPRLRWSRYTAFKRLSEHDKAIDEATRLIGSGPYDFYYWWWRAQANEEAGKPTVCSRPTRSCGVKSFLVRRSVPLRLQPMTRTRTARRPA
jgi:hypothetical protein